MSIPVKYIEIKLIEHGAIKNYRKLLFAKFNYLLAKIYRKYVILLFLP